MVAYTGSRRSIVIDEQQQIEDDGSITDPQSGSPDRANFAEILMLRINDALENYNDGTPEGEELRRYGCVVRTDTFGRLKITFGSRVNATEQQSVLGWNFTVQIGDEGSRTARFGKVNKRLCMMLGIPAAGVRVFNYSDPRHYYYE